MRAAPKLRWLFGALSVGVVLSGSSCNPGEEEVDQDGDTFTISDGDCNDFDPNINPLAVDVCDGQDNNCNFKVDEVDDKDQDGASACNGGDCDDLNPAVFPGADEIFDNLDNDCNCIRDPNVGDTNGDGIVCGPGDDGVDDDPRGDDLDGDGFCEGVNNGGTLECRVPGVQAGDCNELSPLVSPGSIEVSGDGIDNDCNGQTDEPATPCDGGLNAGDPFSFAKAMGLGCKGEVQTAQFIGPLQPGGTSDSRGRAIVSNYGSGGLNFPFEGDNFVIFSSGIATSTIDHSSFGSEDLGNTFPHPNPQPAPNDGCGVADETTVHDYTEYRITVVPPPNATGFSYRLQFLSGEYPEFHCSSFDDTFFAILSSQGFNGNISFDANGKVISINSGFFQICNTNDQGNVCSQPTNPELSGTGFETSGGTKSLVTTVPSIPANQPFTLQFIIFDEFDGVLDSSILLDGWEWIGVPCVDDPVTLENECDPSTKIP